MARKALLIHAHSEADSFVTAMRDRIAASLAGQDCEVRHSDLYAMNWNPVLSPADFGERKDDSHLVYALEQRHNHANGTLAPDVLAEIAKVDWADLLVFTFPLFWFSVPAILKGWIDRVFVSGHFYGGKAIYARGGLAGKQAIAAFSLGGREDMFGAEGIHGPLAEGMLRSFLQGSLGYVGLEVLEPLIIYRVPYLDLAQRQQALEDIGQAIEGLPARAVMPMPDLDRFGARFEPLA